MSQSFDTPPPLQPKAQQEMERWRAEHDEMLGEALSAPLRILVWGTGDVAPDAQGQERKRAVVKKRIQIRDELILKGYAVIFSEHWPSPQSSKASLLSNEATQAYTVHLIILLVEESIGAHGELHDFAIDEVLARKMLVMFPRHYEQGYAGQGIVKLLDQAYGNIYWYEDSEIEGCQVLTKALECADARRQLAAMRKLRGGA